jgi:protein-S-isoprenylcysteine O-methyltransferase Ste14
MALQTKWIEIVHTVATGSRTIRNLFTPVGALIYASLIFLFVLGALQVDRLLGITGIFPEPFSIVLSLPLFSLALFLIGWSVLNFISVKGTPVPFNPPPQVVTTGPYKYVRNPMLSGVFALLFALGALLGSISLLVLFTPLFIYLNVWELKAIEEPELLKRLGEDYAEYRERTPMFFPSIGTVHRRRK